MLEKTKKYDLFKFRDDNRKIDSAHVNKLKESIKQCNLLEFRPLEVNDKMEIMDGQHRLMAARELGVDIYYKIVADMKPENIILIQTAKNWVINEYFDYYLFHKYQEYIKLKEFMQKNRLGLQMALIIAGGKNDKNFHSFKMGKYVFKDEEFGNNLETIHDTVAYIKRINGISVSKYADSVRFWKALIVMMKHPNFDSERWFKNLGIHVTKYRPLATFRDYLKLNLETYNYKNSNKIILDEDVKQNEQSN